jgi:hypothetical protein
VTLSKRFPWEIHLTLFPDRAQYQFVPGRAEVASETWENPGTSTVLGIFSA